MKIHHIAISVKSLEESVNWYIKHFGFVETHRVKRLNKEIALLELNNTNLEIFQSEESFPAPDYEGDLSEDLKRVGVRHFGINVENLKEKVELFRANGTEIVSEIKPAFYDSFYCFIKDPDGILVELVGNVE